VDDDYFVPARQPAPDQPALPDLSPFRDRGPEETVRRVRTALSVVGGLFALAAVVMLLLALRAVIGFFDSLPF
jgi:hypothetical protein